MKSPVSYDARDTFTSKQEFEKHLFSHEVNDFTSQDPQFLFSRQPILRDPNIDPVLILRPFVLVPTAIPTAERGDSDWTLRVSRVYRKSSSCSPLVRGLGFDCLATVGMGGE
jgi:hypothetical protein